MSEIIQSVATSGGMPLWRLTNVKAESVDRLRPLITNDADLDGSIYQWVARGRKGPSRDQGNLNNVSLFLLDRLLVKDVGAALKEEVEAGVLMSRFRPKENQPRWFRMDQGRIGFVLEKLGVQTEVLNGEWARKCVVSLVPEGLEIDVKLPVDRDHPEWRLLLTVDEFGALVWRWRPKDSPAAASLYAMIQPLSGIVTPGSWFDWRWNRLPEMHDMGFAADRRQSGPQMKLSVNTRNLHLPGSMFSLLMQDQSDQSSLVPLSQQRLSVRRCLITLDEKHHPLHFTLEAGPQPSDQANWRYELVPAVSSGPSNATWTESLKAGRLGLQVAAGFRTRMQELRPSDTLRRVFTPIEQGWLMLDIDALGTDPKPGDSGSDDSDLPTRIRFPGGFEVGIRRLEREQHAAAREQLPWSARFQSCAGLSLEVAVTGSLPQLSLKGVKASMSAPDVQIRGLLWCAVGRDDDDDLLPELALDSLSLRDVIFVVPGTRSRRDDVVVGGPLLDLSAFRLHRTIGGEHPWPSMDFERAEIRGLTGTAVGWMRHPRLPAIQIMPLTAARHAPTRAIASRELLPIRLDVAHLRLTNERTGWPVLDARSQGFWWPPGAEGTDEHPPSGELKWPEDPAEDLKHLDRGIGLAALSMAGVEFWTTKDSVERFQPSVRIDLPWSDEAHALAEVPASVEKVNLQDDVGSKEGETDKVEPVASTWPDLSTAAAPVIRSAWLDRHDAWTLSMGQGTVLMDRAGRFDAECLLPGHRWVDGGLFVDDHLVPPSSGQVLQLGFVDVQLNAASTDRLSGDSLLAGLDAQVRVSDHELHLSRGDIEPRMRGFSLPLIQGDAHQQIDGDGVHRYDAPDAGVPQRVDVSGEAWQLCSMQQAHEIANPGKSIRFWCRQLPCVEKTGGLEFAPDPPMPRAPLLEGHEWRLFSESSDHGRIALNDRVSFEPVRLADARFEWKETGNGRILIPVSLTFDIAVYFAPLDSGTIERLGYARMQFKDGTLTLSNADELFWLMPPIRLVPAIDTASTGPRPLMKIGLTPSGSMGKCRWHGPVLGRWRTIDVVPVEGDLLRFQLAPGAGSGEVSLIEFNLGALVHETRVDLKIQVNTAGIAGTLSRTTVNDTPSMFVQWSRAAFPVAANDHPVERCDPLVHRGFSMILDLEVPRFAPCFGLSFENTKQTWILGLGLDLTADRGLTDLWLEGEVWSSEAAPRPVFQLMLTRSAKTLAFEHHARIQGEWTNESLIRWPEPKPKSKDPNNEVTWNWARAARSTMKISLSGQILSGSGYEATGLGTMDLPVQQPFEAVTRHSIQFQGGKVLELKGLHPVAIVQRRTWLRHLQEEAKVEVQPPFASDSVLLGDFLRGIRGKPFLEAASASQPKDDALMMLASPCYLMEGLPLRFLHVGLLSGQVDVHDTWINQALGKPALQEFWKTVGLSSADLETAEATVAVQTETRRIVRIEKPSWRQGLSAFWARQGVLEIRADVMDSGWTTAEAFGRIHPHETKAQPALARSIVSLFHWATNGLDEDKVLTIGAERGAVSLIDPRTLQVRPLPLDPFAEAADRRDVLICGRHGYQVIPYTDSVNDAFWLRVQIEGRLGPATFAVSRGEFAAVLEVSWHLPSPVWPEQIQPSLAPDPARGPFRAPHESLMAPSPLRTELIHRTPFSLPAPEATTGTRHFHRQSAVAGSTLRVLHWASDRVRFAAPAAMPRVIHAHHPESTAWSNRQADNALLFDNRGSPKQFVSPPYRETVATAQRPGVMRGHRESLVLLHGADQAADTGHSLVHGFRAPRPLALPQKRQCRSILKADSESVIRRLDVVDGIADAGWVPGALVEHGAPMEPWLPVLLRLTSPSSGVIGPTVQPDLTLEWSTFPRNEALPSPAAPSGVTFGWRASLVIGERSYPMGAEVVMGATAGKGTIRCRLRISLDQVDASDGDAVFLNLFACPTTAGAGLPEPAVPFQFPLRWITGARFSLPMRAHTALFFDRVFNETLGSMAQQNRSVAFVFALDQMNYVMGSSAVLMMTQLGTTQSKGDPVVFSRIRNRGPGTPAIEDPLQLFCFAGHAASLTPDPLVLKSRLPVRIDLTLLRLAARPSEGLRAGDLLRLQCEGLTAYVTIVARPVLPPPDASYGLWQKRRRVKAGASEVDTTVEGIRCARYGTGVMPDRVTLLDAVRDLEVGYVRRFATFRWHHVVPLWEHERVEYFLQRIDAVGASHFPADWSEFEAPV